MTSKLPPKGILSQQFDATVALQTPSRDDTKMSLHGIVVADPYHALEDFSVAKSQAFAAAQEEIYQDFTSDETGRENAIARLKPLLDPPEQGMPGAVEGGYVFLRKGEGERLAKAVFAEHLGGATEVLVDPLAVDPSGKTEIGGLHPSPDGKLLAYRIGSAWEKTVRIRDMATGKDLPDQVQAGSLFWDRDGKGFTYNHLEEEPRRVVLSHHRLGDDARADKIVYDAGALSSSAFPAYTNFRNSIGYAGPQDWLISGTAAGANDAKQALALKDPDTGAYKTIFPQGAFEIAPVTQTPEGTLFWTAHDAPNGRVIMLDPDNPAPENWKTVIPEDPRRPLKHVVPVQDRLVGWYSNGPSEELEAFGLDGAAKGKVPLPPMVRIDPTSTVDGKQLHFKVSGYEERGAVYHYDPATNMAEPVLAGAKVPGMDDCVIETLETRSKDGTMIPMTVVRRKDAALDGTAALKLYGYGGYGYGTGPQNFDAEQQDFVRGGGIFAIAHVRGGGEFGQAWHDGGRGANKQNSVDDFIACAKHLADTDYTSPKRLVSEGHSNGGMLVLAAMLQAPDAFGAVISSCPVADMLSDKLDAYRREYGSPRENRRDFDAVMKYSPLQNIKPGAKYPPLQIRTAAGDRDLIGGALKFAATMQHDCPKNLTLLHVEQGFGHATARPTDVALNEIAAKNIFIERCIGPVAQNDYRRTLAIGGPVQKRSLG